MEQLSKLKNFSIEEQKKILINSNSCTEALIKFGYTKNTAGNYGNKIRELAKELNVNISHYIRLKNFDYFKKGDVIGRLTIISSKIRKNSRWYYKCKCECGNEKLIRSDHLRKKETISCGCVHIEKVREALMEDLSGQHFGSLTVLSISQEKESNKRGVYWSCKCDCGKIKDICSADLKSGHAKSCGCLNLNALHERLEDLIGQVFNYLKVIALDEKKREEKHQGYWFCRCLLCGRMKQDSVSSSSLKSGQTKSCGCLKSQYEEKIAKILEDNSIIFKRQYSFPDLKGNVGFLYFDFAIFDNNYVLKYLIEFQGEQHYRPVEYFGGEEKFLLQQKYDKTKVDYCNQNNIKLIILNKQNLLTKEEIIKEELL